MRYCFICDECNYRATGEFVSPDAVSGEIELDCPICWNKLRRDYKAEQVNFILTGDGFYTTEHRATQEDKGS